MIIGFTGTRNGMTQDQMRALSFILYRLQPFHFHHGDCVGADAQAAHMASRLAARIICHPPIKEDDRAFFPFNDEMRPPCSYFERNRQIVKESSMLIGASFGSTEHPTGGTWYTIRYAIEQKKPVIILWPDGTMEQR